MRIAIMQPTWLPWCGYFDLIDQVDQFVFLDTVQFCRRSWHSRNRIKTRDGFQWISVPVRGGSRSDTMLVDAKISPGNQTRKWENATRNSYTMASNLDNELPIILDGLDKLREGASLATVNINLIQMLMERLGITTPTVRASELPKFDGRVDRLVGICKHLEASTYVSAPGSAQYLRPEVDKFKLGEIELCFHRYDHPIWRQCHGSFLPYVSVIDLILNHGLEAIHIIRSGQRTSLAAHEFFGDAEWQNDDRKSDFEAA